MNASFRPSTIEALKSLWVALPVRASNDGADGDPRERQMAILSLYADVLSEFSEAAICNTVNNLRSGKIEDASKSFCPKAPELAVLVRSEQSRLDAINRPKAVSYQPVERPFIDWRETHLNRVFKERRAFIEHATIDQSQSRARQRKYPPFSLWLWSLGPVDSMLGSMYGPPDSAASDAQIWGPNRQHVPASVVIHV